MTDTFVKVNKLNWGTCPGDAKQIKAWLDEATVNEVAEVVHGYWINTPPYTASNGNFNKAQECSVCNAYFVSSGYTKYSNHPYCCECGSKMDFPSISKGVDSNGN